MLSFEAETRKKAKKRSEFPNESQLTDTIEGLFAWSEKWVPEDFAVGLARRLDRQTEDRDNLWKSLQICTKNLNDYGKELAEKKQRLDNIKKLSENRPHIPLTNEYDDYKSLVTLFEAYRNSNKKLKEWFKVLEAELQK